jgi:AraC-like DNA-binding protein
VPVLFSLEGVRPADRAMSLDAALSSYRIPLRMKLREHSVLRARLEATRVGETEIESFSITGASGSVSRPATGDGGPHLTTLHLISSGSVELMQAGNRTRPRDGDIVVSSTRYPFTTSQAGACNQFTFSFREQDLSIQPDRVRPLLATALQSADPIVQVISEHLRTLARSAMANPSDNWVSLEETTSGLARALILHAVGDHRATREALGSSLVDRVFEYVRRNLADPDLSAVSIAAAHSISTRYLHMLIARRDTTLTSWIRRRRSERAAALLVLQPALPIAQIAYTCGFADQSHFARTFKQELGCTPREWRSTHAQSMEAPVIPRDA